MVLANNKSFLFVHIPKTGGDAISHALISRTRSRIYLDERKHWSAKQIRRGMFGDGRWDGCWKFSIVRNPFEQVHSDYWFCRTVDLKPHWYRYHYMLGWLKKCERTRKQTFEEFVAEHCRPGTYGMWFAFLTDHNGKQLVNFIGRHERLADDWGKIQRHLNLKPGPLPRRNITPKRPQDYRIDYTPRAKDLVAKRFKGDLERFSYEF